MTPFFLSIFRIIYIKDKGINMPTEFLGYNKEAKESYDKLRGITNSIKQNSENYKILINFNNTQDLMNFILRNKDIKFTIEKI